MKHRRKGFVKRAPPIHIFFMERLSSMLYPGGSQQQYRYDTVGNPVGYTTRAKLRLTEAGWRALQTNLGDVLRAAAPSAPSGPQPLPADTFWAPIHSAIKTVNVHAQDGKYNADTLATFEQAATQLDAYQAKTAPERAMKKPTLPRWPMRAPRSRPRRPRPSTSNSSMSRSRLHAPRGASASKRGSAKWSTRRSRRHAATPLPIASR